MHATATGQLVQPKCHCCLGKGSYSWKEVSQSEGKGLESSQAEWTGGARGTQPFGEQFVGQLFVGAVMPERVLTVCPHENLSRKTRATALLLGKMKG